MKKKKKQKEKTIMGYEKPGSGGDSFSFEDNVGALCVFAPFSLEEINTKMGMRDAVKADVLIVESGKIYKETLLFPKMVFQSLVRSLGMKVLARIAQGVAKPGQNAPWILVDATENPADVAAAEAAERTFGFQSKAPVSNGPKADAPF